MSTLTITTRRPGVAQVTMNRPEVFNAFDEAMIGELDAAFAQLEADDTVRVGASIGRVSGFVPVPKAGPVLTWKPLSTSRVPAIRGLRLQLGDVELF